MESYPGCTPTSDYYQNRTTAQREHDLLTKGIIIYRVKRHNVLLSINQNYEKI